MYAAGPYVLEEVLGSGGIGVVYAARPRSGGARLAVKVLDSRVCTDDVRRRFANEAAIATAVRHPNVVQVLGHGETPDGSLWLAMELLEGETLAVRIGRTVLEAPEAVRIGTAAAAGLGATHAAGIVHRDVKPANVFLCADGGVRMLDFGLALPLGGEQSRVTAPSSVMGTPSYMAPEQARGTHTEDARTDVWGLGATLYHALAGRPPFEAATPMATLVRLLTEEVEPLPDEVPPTLAAAVLRAIDKDPDARFPTTGAMARALEDALVAGIEYPTAKTIVFHRDDVAIPLGDEVRIVSVLVGAGVSDVDAFAREVRAERGVAARIVGRRAVGVFGGEAWLGDEAARAVRAGLAVRGAGAAARLGVATGRAVHARAGDVTGAVVAAAEAALSPEGDGVGIDGETRRRIRGGFDTREALVFGRRRGRAVIGVQGLGGADVPLVGREREIGDIEATFAQVVSESQAAGVLLVGPPGIGKSRLLQAFSARTDEKMPGVIWLEGRGESHRTLQGWHAFASVVRAFLEIPEGTPPPVVRQKLLDVCPRTVAEFLGEILGADFESTPHLETARADPIVMRDRVVFAAGDFVERLVSSGPVILALEDLHWADAPSLDLVEVLLRRLERRRLLVVGTSRPELDAPLPELRRVPLSGISRQATRALVEAVLGERESDRSADPIHERSGGNPYFAEELALSLREGRTELPASVEAAVQARLDALPREEKDLLRRASVLGTRFWVEAIVATGEADPASALARLRRRELVAPEPVARLAGTNEWRFRHALVQEVAYASLTDEPRALLHLAVGRWLAHRPDAPAQEIARHLALGGDADGAAPYWLRAAETAFAEGDAPLLIEASTHALAQGAIEAELRLRRMRIDVFGFLGRRADVAGEIAALEPLVVGTAHEPYLHAMRVKQLRAVGRQDQAAAEIAKGLALAPGDAMLLFEEGACHVECGRPKDALVAAKASLEAARAAKSSVGIARALDLEGTCNVVLGDIGAALGFFEKALEIFDTAGDPRRAAGARVNVGYAALLGGRHADAARELETSRDFARGCGNRRAEGYALHNLALARARLGDVAGALAAVEDALAIARDIELPRLRVVCLLYRAAILLEAGRGAEALPLFDRALAEPAELRADIGPFLHGLRAGALVAVGRREEALAEATHALALRDAAGGMAEFEAELFLAAHAAGVDGAIARGQSALLSRADKISDPDARRGFLEEVPAHARLLALAPRS